MLFNSLSFALFLPIVFSLYWFVMNKTLKLQNLLLLCSSYFFYACWDWRFLFLLLFSTSLDYFTGIKIATSTSKSLKRFWFWLSIVVNLGCLGVFKYYDFFAISFAETIKSFGFHVDIWTLRVILPVGISFYTFHGLSYIIDIYQGRIKPEKNFINYSLFVSFFPLLVAGPIERATHLLPQIQKKRTFNYSEAVDGLRQILWGLVKKIIIADSCARVANTIFNSYEDHSGSTLVLGAIFFSIQIYCDFSGYSDIALGTARLFGIRLIKNFSFPYFSRDIAEFWRRWHISLSTWFRDYLYIPLGGSKGPIWKKIRNTFIIFTVSGFWHGSNWTFIIWGVLNALYIVPSILFKTNRNNLDVVASGRQFPSLKEFLSISLTFALITFSWIFFRSKNLSSAVDYISKIFSRTLFSVPSIRPLDLFSMIILFIGIEWIGRRDNYAIETFALNYSKPLRWSFYALLTIAILYHSGSDEQFIYFQF